MKTIKEAAKNSFDRLSIAGADTNEADFIGGFKIGVEFAQRWIPIEEELPETNEFEESKICLIKGKFGIDIGRYYSYSKNWFLASGNFQVTHWRYVELL